MKGGRYGQECGHEHFEIQRERAKERAKKTKRDRYWPKKRKKRKKEEVRWIEKSKMMGEVRVPRHLSHDNHGDCISRGSGEEDSRPYLSRSPARWAACEIGETKGEKTSMGEREEKKRAAWERAIRR
jgi:hypothetical protein